MLCMRKDRHPQQWRRSDEAEEGGPLDLVVLSIRDVPQPTEPAAWMRGGGRREELVCQLRQERNGSRRRLGLAASQRVDGCAEGICAKSMD